jgi:hypothetical protein
VGFVFITGENIQQSHQFTFLPLRICCDKANKKAPGLGVEAGLLVKADN